MKVLKQIADILPSALLVGVPAGLLLRGGLHVDQAIAIAILAIAGNAGLLIIGSTEKRTSA